MEGLFINHTNHLLCYWSAEQLNAAKRYGEPVDMGFPEIGADWDKGKVQELAAQMAEKIKEKHPAVVLCQGEFTYTHALVCLLQQAEILVLAACSKRVVQEYADAQGNTCKTSVFKFVRFREY